MKGHVDLLLGGRYRDKDESTNTGGDGGKTITSIDGSITIVEETTNYDLSVNKPVLEYFARNEAELLTYWGLARAAAVSARIYIIGTITFTANRTFHIERDEPFISMVGYPRNSFVFGNYEVSFMRVTHENLDYSTTGTKYFKVKEGYYTGKNVRFISDLAYSATLANMRTHIACYSAANNNTGEIVLDDVTHYSQNATLNQSGDIQPIVITNESTGTGYTQLYVKVFKMAAVLSFARFSRLLLLADTSTPYKVTGDESWYHHPAQQMPGTGNIHANSEILKIASLDNVIVNSMPNANNTVKVVGITVDNRLVKTDIEVTGSQYREYTDGTDTMRIGVRAGSMVIDYILPGSETGFAGTEGIDWDMLTSFNKPS